MENITEKEIKKTFINLLAARPVKKITVKEIAQGCGINRNTFYYHFEDIPQLLEKIIEENVEHIMIQYDRTASIEDCLNLLAELSLKNKNIIANIYSSANRNVFELYEWKICEQMASACLNKLLQGRTIPGHMYETIVLDIKCVCFGFIMNWLEKGMKDDVYDKIHQLCHLKEGSIENMIEHASDPKFYVSK